MRLALLTSAAAIAAALPGALAQCECGYYDPATDALWTDATITYFNESGVADVVTNPAASPRIYGDQTSGDTGSGQQAWAVVGNYTNPYELSFGATYRSAFVSNNTFLGTNNQTQGLSMQVSTPDLENHVVDGAEMVTRRRDMLYGSFRTYVLPAQSFNMNGGSGFQFGVAYNDR